MPEISLSWGYIKNGNPIKDDYPERDDYARQNGDSNSANGGVETINVLK